MSSLILTEIQGSSTAAISADEVYRYNLTRTWSPGHRCTWVMLNPSTADAMVNDATIRRCIAFSRQWGFGSLTVVNVFALRATDPNALRHHPDPVGPENDEYIHYAVSSSTFTVAAWGNSWPSSQQPRVAQVAARLHGRAHHLGLTKAGNPMHPLYRPSNVEPEVWL